MPDFSYVVYRPLITRIFSAERARRFTVGALDLQGRFAAGRAVFRWMAHAKPRDELAVRACGLHFPSPVGIAPHIDLDGSALRLWPLLGAGFVIIGPCSSRSGYQRRTASPHLVNSLCSIVVSDDGPCGSLQEARRRLSDPLGRAVPVGVFLRGPSLAGLVRTIGPLADFVVLPRMSDPVRLRELRQATNRPLLMELPIRSAGHEVFHEAEAALEAGFEGCLAAAGSETDLIPQGRLHGPYLRDAALSLVTALKCRFGTDLMIVAGGGILTPGDAQAFLDCGATLVNLFEGLIYAGPGFARRTNHWLLEGKKRCGDSTDDFRNELSTARPSRSAQSGIVVTDVPAQEPPAEEDCGRLWTRLSSLSLAAVALSLIAAGVLAVVLAATTVLLPQEMNTLDVPLEMIATRAEDPLVPFIAHNRVCVAGSLVCLGALYLWLALVPLRHREPWAWWTLLISGAGGSVAWISVLGSQHLLPSWLLAGQLLLSGVFALALLGTRLPARRGRASFLRAGASAWLWSPAGRGRTLVGVWGAGMLLGGIFIMTVGFTSVLVPQDLTYLGYGLSSIRALDDSLVAIIARDRITFGACLFAAGLAALPTIWYGLRPGSMKLLVVLAFAATAEVGTSVGVHPIIGYTNFAHLLPFLIQGVAFFWGALLLSQALLLEEPNARSFQDLWLPINPTFLPHAPSPKAPAAHPKCMSSA